ncbi:unnamed protein product [Anisakis simplex]|uniref:Uncharacterized protein n=1 Tax=Anisakis simplex TaxID=6269 RepID=A0A0M3K3L2_ANISI|nr:unnamed protein product [Anisakis simplex]
MKGQKWEQDDMRIPLEFDVNIEATQQSENVSSPYRFLSAASPIAFCMKDFVVNLRSFGYRT